MVVMTMMMMMNNPRLGGGVYACLKVQGALKEITR